LREEKVHPLHHDEIFISRTLRLSSGRLKKLKQSGRAATIIGPAPFVA
jgi:hypothetical protein